MTNKQLEQEDSQVVLWQLFEEILLLQHPSVVEYQVSDTDTKPPVLVSFDKVLKLVRRLEEQVDWYKALAEGNGQEAAIWFREAKRLETLLAQSKEKENQ